LEEDTPKWLSYLNDTDPMQRDRLSLSELPCPAEKTLKMIGGRWKLLILRQLFTGVKRFGELQKTLAPITQKVLTQQLRELEQDQLLQRVVYAEIPPRVEYSLTSRGNSLQPLVYALHDWSREHSEVNQD
jgi:DNA-binding HxlR family transcriptional regulator